MKKIDETSDVARKEGSGRPKSSHTEENIKLVDEMIFSQEDQLRTHSTSAQITLELNIDCRSAFHIIDQDLDFRLLRKSYAQKFTDSNTENCMIRSRKVVSKYTQKTLQTAFFSDEKIFKVKQL